MNELRDVVDEQLLLLNGFNSVSFPKPKNTYANNIQCKKKRIAKRRARNKNKKR